MTPRSARAGGGLVAGKPSPISSCLISSCSISSSRTAFLAVPASCSPRPPSVSRPTLNAMDPATNQTVTCARAGAEPVSYIQWVIAYTAVQFAFYGLNAVCFSTSAYCLISRGVLGSRPRLGLLAATTVMFMGSTVFVTMDAIQGLYGARDAFGGLRENDCAHLTTLSIAQNVVLRFMFMLSDVIVVWRAWVLWAANRIVRRCLMVCITLTCSCLLADAAVVAWEQATGYYANSALFSLLVTLPILVTNVTVTTTIGLKTVFHYKSMKSAAGSREYGQKVLRALLVLFWSGAAYCVLCLVFFASGVTSNSGRRWGEFVGAIGASVSCTYPTLIIIWAALERDGDAEVQLVAMQDHGVQLTMPSLFSNGGFPTSAMASQVRSGAPSPERALSVPQSRTRSHSRSVRQSLVSSPLNTMDARKGDEALKTPSGSAYEMA